MPFSVFLQHNLYVFYLCFCSGCLSFHSVKYGIFHQKSKDLEKVVLSSHLEKRASCAPHTCMYHSSPDLRLKEALVTKELDKGGPSADFIPSAPSFFPHILKMLYGSGKISQWMFNSCAVETVGETPRTGREKKWLFSLIVRSIRKSSFQQRLI